MINRRCKTRHSIHIIHFTQKISNTDKLAKQSPSFSTSPRLSPVHLLAHPLHQLHKLQHLPPHSLNLLIIPRLLIPVQQLLPLLIQSQYILLILLIYNTPDLIRQHHPTSMLKSLHQLRKPQLVTVTNVRYLLLHDTCARGKV